MEENMEGTLGAKRAAAVAAVAAVLGYLARHGGPQAGAAQAASPGFGAGSCGTSPWALYGRQALMNQRVRMQARRRA